jgi:hypothetical protein
MQSIRPSRSSKTACQVVGLGRPDKFAEGAATGVSHSRKNSSANLLPGILTPIVSKPAVANGEIFFAFGSTNVSGPGKNFSINFPPFGVMAETNSSIWSIFPKCTISGLSDGRPLA